MNVIDQLPFSIVQYQIRPTPATQPKKYFFF